MLSGSADIFYKALLNKDSSYEGTFIAAVKTTGVFCRPTCTARKPKKENVEFYSTVQEAMQHGYRPCKVCRPMDSGREIPAAIQALIQQLYQYPGQRVTDGDLLEKGLEPSRIRRWFIRHHQMTFHAWQRKQRINAAFKKIRQGETITAAAFDAGYESLSAFNDSFKSIFGSSPANSKNKQVIISTTIETPLGLMMACAVEQGICLLEFNEPQRLDKELAWLRKHYNATIIQGQQPHLELLRQQLAEYFAGQRRAFSVPLAVAGTEFQQQVWKALQQIPYGATRSYKQQAVTLQKPEAVRAVANANGMNRISILVPCHRIIGTDGGLTGYGGGLWRKQWLLDLEQGKKGERP